jgi:hypothetical protein
MTSPSNARLADYPLKNSGPLLLLILVISGALGAKGDPFRGGGQKKRDRWYGRGVARLVGIEGGVVSGVFNLESSDV